MKKKLLIFAHKGEAGHFLKANSFTPVDFFFKGLFESPDFFLLICGEGLQNASEKTVSVLTHFNNQIIEVYNLGTAGSLSEKIIKDQIHWVKTCYAGSTERQEYKSFTTQTTNATINCLSALERIETPESRVKLSSFADIVDRELWAIASAAVLFKMPFYSLKYISDDLKSDNFSQEVINLAPLISVKLYLEFIKKI